jgi:hypothetical protein
MNLKTTETWATLSKKVFWDRDVPLAKWRQGIAAGHRAYLPASIATMTPAQFIRFYGLDAFKRTWPTLRAGLPAATLQHAPIFDLAWSQAVGGGYNLVPTPDYYTLSPKRRAFLTHIAKTPGQSIYQAAKDLGMQYRRAHDHAQWLAATGKIRTVEATHNGRRQKKLFPPSKRAHIAAF